MADAAGDVKCGDEAVVRDSVRLRFVCEPSRLFLESDPGSSDFVDQLASRKLATM